MHGSNGLVRPWKNLNLPKTWRGLKKHEDRYDGNIGDEIDKRRRWI
jgi:hypothetical protein